MATTERTKLNTLYRQWAPGIAPTSEDLAAQGISADLAALYVRAGWLFRLARTGQYVPRLKRSLTSALDEYKILYRVK